MNKTLSLICAGIVGSAVFNGTPLQGQVTVHGLFGNGAVVQRDMPIPVWGRAPAGMEVTVVLGDQRGAAKTGADGVWRVELPAMQAGGPHEMTIAGGTNTHVFKNVLVGEVWLCAGGAGMDATVGSVPELVALVAARPPGIRIVGVPGQIASAPSPAFASRPQWIAASMDQGVASLSAVAVTFAIELQRRLSAETLVPVGIIQSTAVNTLTESWVSRPGLLASPETRGLVEAYDAAVAQYLEASRNYGLLFKQWTIDMAAAEESGAPFPQGPPLPPEPRSNPRKVCGYFNGTISVMAPYAIRGVLWSHGELDVTKPDLHRHVFTSLIASWRELWKTPALPFIFTQLGKIGAPADAAAETTWAAFRTVQESVASSPQTAMVKTMDIEGKPAIETGKRMADTALKITYSGHAGVK